MAQPDFAKIGSDPNFQYRGLENFAGLNTKARRPAIKDEECYWLENIFPIGDGNARALYDRGTTLYTAPGGNPVVYAASYNIGDIDYDFYTLTDGSAVQVRVSNGAVTTIAAAATFYNGGDLPHITQWGNSGILIISNANADGYFAWDGTLYSPGGPSPSWLSGLDSPLVLAGASHSNTTLDGFASTVGVTVGMLVTGSMGDIPPDTFVTGGTSTTVTISNAATGSNSQDFTFSWQMPTAIKGTGIDTFQGRVFIVDGAKRLMSAASNGTLFSASGGGSIVVSSDSVLRKHYSTIVSANGYIYPFGDSSIFNISNVQQSVSSGVTTATYQYSNTDPQTGTEWQNSVTVFGRSIIFGNPNGIYSLVGNSATKISDALDGIFATLDTSVIPTAGVGTLYGIRILAVCLRAKDYLGVTRNFLCLFDGRKWFAASQTTAPTFIWTREIESALTIMGTNGEITYPLFQIASASLLKTMQSKLYGGSYGYLSTKMGTRYYLQREILSAESAAPTVTVDSETSSAPVQGSLSGMVVFTNALGAPIQFQNASAQNIFWTLSGLINFVNAVTWGTGLLGFTYTDTTPDFVIERTGVSYRDQNANY